MADFVNFDGIDTFNAPDERNELFGTGPNNQTTGNENDFLFRGVNDTDTYFGGSGTDRVSISPGSDAYYGNGGLNTIDFLFSFVDIWQTDKEEENAENWFATTNGVVVDTGAGTYSVTYSEFTSGVSDFDETYDGILVGFWRFTGTGGDDLFIGSNVITQTVPGGFDFGEEFEPAAGNDTIFGGAGQDTLGYFELVNVAGADGVIVDAQAKTVVKKGGLGNDIFNGIERFELSLFDDSFRGSGRDETVVGLGGNDSVNGRGGDDLLDFNFFVFQQVGITLDMDDETATTGDGGTVTFSNFELIRGSRWADTMNGGDNRDTLQGWDGDDVITGGKSGDVLYGGDDNDLLAGNGGNDFFTGDSGDDTFIGAAGTDVANYGDERGDLGVVVDLDAGTATDTHGDTDTLEGIEHVIGTDEDDTISGSDEDEDLSGGIGADTLSGRGGNDELSGEAGRDELYGQGGQDTLYGGAFDDLMRGGSNNDELYGGEGQDKLYGESGDDTLYGLDNPDTLFGGSGRDTLFGNKGGDLIRGGSNSDRINGGKGGDTLYGDDNSDTIDGRDGEDTLFGGDAIDTLNGGDGNDLMYGGKSNDLFIASKGGDVFFGGTGAGDLMDFSRAAQRVDLDMKQRAVQGQEFGFDSFVDVEDFVSGAGNDLLAGDSQANWIRGEDGDDFIVGAGGEDSLFGGRNADELFGGAKDDFLHGGFGNDKITGGAGSDRFIMSRGNDTFLDFSVQQDILDVSGAGGVDAVSFANFEMLENFARGNSGRIIIEEGNNALTILGVGIGDLDILNIDFA